MEDCGREEALKLHFARAVSTSGARSWDALLNEELTTAFTSSGTGARLIQFGASDVFAVEVLSRYKIRH